MSKLKVCTFLKWRKPVKMSELLEDFKSIESVKCIENVKNIKNVENCRK